MEILMKKFNAFIRRFLQVLFFPVPYPGAIVVQIILGGIIAAILLAIGGYRGFGLPFWVFGGPGCGVIAGFIVAVLFNVGFKKRGQ